MNIDPRNIEASRLSMKYGRPAIARKNGWETCGTCGNPNRRACGHPVSPTACENDRLDAIFTND